MSISAKSFLLFMLLSLAALSTVAKEQEWIAPTKAQQDAAVREFLAAAKQARAMRVYAVDPEIYPPSPKCKRARCLAGLVIGGEVEVPAAKMAVVRSALDSWLVKSPRKLSGCMAEHHHAISFAHKGHEYVVHLCYTCGQYDLYRDGELKGYGARWDPSGLAALNALLAAGGVKGHVPPK